MPFALSPWPGDEEEEASSAPVGAVASDEEDERKSWVRSIVDKNADLNFVKRIRDTNWKDEAAPKKWPVLEQPDGKHASHKMAWATVDGRAVVYPTVVYDEKAKALRQLEDREALDYALETGENIQFDSEEEADAFSRDYKLYERSGATPRAFRREPAAKGFELSPWPGEEPPESADTGPVPVSQLPGVIPQEDVYPEETDTLPETFGKGLLRGVRSVPRMALQTAQALGAGASQGIPGLAHLPVEKGIEALQDPRSIQPEGDYSTGQQYIAGVAQALPQLLGTALATAAAGPPGGLAFAFSQEAGAAFERAQAEGASPPEATQAALTTGLISGALDYSPVGALFKRLAGKAGTTAVGHVIATTLQEFGTEVAQDVVAELTALGTYLGDKEISADEVVALVMDPEKRKQLAMTGAIGGTLGLGGGLVTAKSAAQAGRDARQKATREQFEAVREAAQQPEAPLDQVAQSATEAAPTEVSTPEQVEVVQPPPAPPAPTATPQEQIAPETPQEAPGRIDSVAEVEARVEAAESQKGARAALPGDFSTIPTEPTTPEPILAQEGPQPAAPRTEFSDTSTPEPQPEAAPPGQIDFDVFHGSPSGDITAFDSARLGRASGHPTAKLGAFFSDDPNVAADFAVGWGTSELADSGTVYRAKVRLSNPLRLSEGSLSLEEIDRIDGEFSGFAEAYRDFVYPAADKKSRDPFVLVDWLSRNHVDPRGTLRALGYDGIMVPTGVDSSLAKGSSDAGESTIFVVFDPEGARVSGRRKVSFRPGDEIEGEGFQSHGYDWSDEVLGFAQPLPDEIVDLVEPGNVTRFFRKFFTKAAGAPKAAFEYYERARSEARANVLEASHAANDWLSDWKKGGRSEEARGALSRYLHGDTEALVEIPTAAGRKAAQVMRRMIDALQLKLMQSGAIPEGSVLEAVVGDSIGTYVRRQYRAFREPGNWSGDMWFGKGKTDKDGVREPGKLGRKHPEILANARHYAEGQLKAAGEDASPDAVEARLRMLFPSASEQSNPFALLDKVGRKDLSLFMKKKDVPEVIRKLLGEYEDPVTNFFQTYQHIGQVIANHKMLSSVAETGKKQGWLVAEPTGNQVESIAPDAPAYSPLSGLYASREVAEAYKRLVNPTKAASSTIGRLYLRAVGTARAAKTVYNLPTTHLRNVYGNYPLMLANGNWGAFGSKNKPAWKAAWAAAFDDIRRSDDAAREFAVDLTRLGVIGQSIGVNNLRELEREAGFTGNILADPGRQAANGIYNTLRRIGDAYGAEDDGPKALSFLLEYAKHRDVYPDMPSGELRALVANKVKDSMPTWGRINPNLRDTARKLPFGNFVSFHLEILRTRANVAQMALQEIKDGSEMQRRGKESGNDLLVERGKKLENMGGIRFLSNTLVPTLLFAGLAEVSKALWGISDDDEEKLSRGFAPWEKYSPKWYLGSPEKGKVSFLNLGYINPFSITTEPLKAVLDNLDDPEKAMSEGLAEFLQPFFDTDFMAQLFIDVITGKEHDGGVVDILRDGGGMEVTRTLRVKGDPENWNRMQERVLSEMSLWRFFRRVERGWKGAASESGQVAGVGAEVASQMSGFRVSVRDWGQTLNFRRDDYAEDLSDAKRFFRRPAETKAAPEPEKIKSGFRSFVQQTIERQRSIHQDFEAARHSGLTDDQIFNLVTASGGLGKGLTDNLLGATIVLSIPETPHGDAMLEELEAIADEVVSGYQERYRKEGLTIVLE